LRHRGRCSVGAEWFPTLARHYRRRSSDPRKLELFTCRIATEAGALVSVLGGLDGLVFTARIGEHAPTVRAAVCARLAWLGLRLGEGANAAGAARIGARDSSIDVRVIATDEEAVIARHTMTTLSDH